MKEVSCLRGRCKVPDHYDESAAAEGVGPQPPRSEHGQQMAPKGDQKEGQTAFEHRPGHANLERPPAKIASIFEPVRSPVLVSLRG